MSTFAKTTLMRLLAAFPLCRWVLPLLLGWDYPPHFFKVCLLMYPSWVRPTSDVGQSTLLFLCSDSCGNPGDYFIFLYLGGSYEGSPTLQTRCTTQFTHSTANSPLDLQHYPKLLVTSGLWVSSARCAWVEPHNRFTPLQMTLAFTSLTTPAILILNIHRDITQPYATPALTEN